MGGGASPTHLRLRQAVGRVDTLIVNAAECEPLSDRRPPAAAGEGDQVLQGVQMMARLLRVERAVLVVAGDKLNAVEFLERRLRRKEAGGGTAHHPDPLSPGHGKQLDPHRDRAGGASGQSALDVKCRIQRGHGIGALRPDEGEPLTHRAVTVSGGAVARPRNLWVPIGTPCAACWSRPAACGRSRGHPHRRPHDRDGAGGTWMPQW